tara:strand:+ start:3468 stop:3692 length:225 start_codon:yes stop_codon:yes gene_type:complete
METTYCVVLEKRSNKARVYARKMDAIYDHVRFRAKQKVWFFEDLTKRQVERRTKGAKVVLINAKGERGGQDADK